MEGIGAGQQAWSSLNGKPKNPQSAHAINDEIISRLKGKHETGRAGQGAGVGTYLYLLKEREHIRCGDDVCKAGFTTDFACRMRAYPNGSAVVLSMRIRRDAGREAERLVLTAFERCFKHRRDIGAEYFEGPVSDMVAMLASVASRFACTPDDDVPIGGIAVYDEDEEDVAEDKADVAEEDGVMDDDDDDDSSDGPLPPARPSVAAVPAIPAPPPDAMQIVFEFVRPRLANLEGCTMSADSLFAQLVAESGHHRACPRLASFISLVAKMFDATCRKMDITFPGPVVAPAVPDPRLHVVEDLVDEHVTFGLARSPELRGRKVLGFVRRSDLIQLIRNKHIDVFKGMSSAAMKALLDGVMEARGRPLALKTTIGSDTDYNVYKNCALRDM
jgi:hypothetical protein